MGIKVEVLYTSSSLREIIENISLSQEVFEFISTSY